MAQQTAVDWFFLWFIDNPKATHNEYLKAFDKAKLIEKENVINAWDNRCTKGTFIGGWHIETKSGEEYYNETYNNGTI